MLLPLALPSLLLELLLVLLLRPPVLLRFLVKSCLLGMHSS